MIYTRAEICKRTEMTQNTSLLQYTNAPMISTCTPVFSNTGLDQPIAFFDTDDLRVRLDRSDASFVDIIRTIRLDSENIESPEEIGHVIFYPNNALSQPGCEPGDVGEFL